ncbi:MULTISPECIES: GNAT family N-acetyltransferase [Niallia]|uniref:GNAT family N-acetyltransferase n=1 Tax=Niallia TaxID=2837506 RepID=UPI001F186F50|nr:MULTISPECIES: GNAT family N-acetyltransferase [Niallia]MCM3364566.1 GNAT family N-acetyltransferase [Niallia sp. MER TA 168]
MVRLLAINKNENIINKMEELYKQVWNKSIKERLIRHTTYEGFRGYIIITAEEELLGFAYGYTSLPGQYYHELLSIEVNQKQYETWLKDCFEVVEFAVHPLYRNKGYGKKLIHELLKGVENKTAVLTTQVNNTVARHLYKQMRWIVIKEPFIPSEHEATYVIMGKVLN